MAASSVLVIAAHPDDEILGCGATAARLVDEGCEVYFAILGEELHPGTSRGMRLTRYGCAAVVAPDTLAPRATRSA